MKGKIDEILNRFEILKGERGKWEGGREDIKKYVSPQTTLNSQNFSSTAVWARTQLASSLQSLMINPASNWFNISMSNAPKDDTDINNYCNFIRDSLNKTFNFPGSNFFSQVHEFFLTLTGFGTAVFYVEEDESLPYCMFFRNIPLEECYFSDNKYGYVDSMYRKFNMTLRVATSIWPDNAKLSKQAEIDPDEKIDILHAVFKDDNNTDKKEYSSCYLMAEDKEILQEGGYSYFPFLVTRWVKSDNEAYGYAPAHHVMPDIKLLNEYLQLGIKVAQKQANPALLVPRNGYYMPFNTNPGKINYYDGGVADKVLPFTDFKDIEPALAQQEQCRDAIIKAFYVDIFKMGNENKEMTATEVDYRSQEQMRLMSPIVGRIEAEFLNPLIQTVYKIMLKYKLIENVGKKEDMNIEYVSPLAQAQKVNDANSINHLLSFINNSGASNFAPEVYDNLDFDLILKLFANVKNCPDSIFKDEKEVSRIRQQRELQQQEAMQQQGAQQ